MFSRMNVVFWFSHVGGIGLVIFRYLFTNSQWHNRHGITKLNVLNADVQLPLLVSASKDQ